MDTAITYLLDSEINGQIKRTCELLNVPELAAKIKWNWNHGMRSVIGVANLNQLRIQFSSKLFALLSPEERRDTIIHEVCHHVAFQVYVIQRKIRIKGHGREWQMLMRQAGGTPKRCSKAIPEAAGLRRKWSRITFFCKCREHEITSIKAGQIKSGKKSWICRTCRAPLCEVRYTKDFVRPQMAAETVKPTHTNVTRDSINAQIEDLKREKMLAEIERLRQENERLKAQQGKK